MKNGQSANGNVCHDIVHYLSSDGHTQMHTEVWKSETERPRAILQITHGMQEYIGRYADFARFLAEKGFLVAGQDQLGHGHTARSAEELGYMGENPAELMVRDIQGLREMLQEQYPDVPYFMLGHSMGSYLLRRYLCEYGSGLSGAIVMGTGQITGPAIHAARAITRCLAAFRGWHHRSRLVSSLSTGSGPYTKFNLDGTKPENSWLTKDVEIVRKYYQDPFCTFTFTLNGYLALFDAVYYDGQAENVAKMPKDLPIYLVSGTDDPVGDMGEGVKKVYEAFRAAGIRDLSMKLFQGDRHEILNETDREEVYLDMLRWMDSRIPQ